MLDFKKHSTRILFLRTLLLVLLVYLLFFDTSLPLNSKSTPDSNSTIDYFITAKGKIHLNEVIENVFNKYGYSFVKNDIIPILKKTVPMQCVDIFNEWQKITKNGLTVEAPKELLNPETFLLNNYSSLSSVYSNDVPKNEEPTIPIWEEKFINTWINKAKDDPLGIPASYINKKLQIFDSVAVYVATKYFDLNEKSGAVIGSQTPWVEAYLLANGAKNVTTIDYQKIKTMHPQMSFLYAPDLPSLQKVYNNYFDFIVSFSSIEHSGLGRYGDPIDPIGDIREMNKIHCMLKPNGLLFLSVPIGQDAIVYNLHRIYGRMRLAMMFEGYTLLKVFYSDSKGPINLIQSALKKKRVHLRLFSGRIRPDSK